MAILSNTGFYGFLSSCKRVAEEYIEDFKTGFDGSGWKIWKRPNGKYRFEIDEMTIRGSLTVFELLVQKIRAVKGAMAITQGSGKIKEVVEQENRFVIRIEDEMSFMTDDYIKCQTFGGSGAKSYHVKVTVDIEYIYIDKSEFDRDNNGDILCKPEVGDEIVQFGNSSDTNRQSAIYLHADESGYPAIDLMLGINSKDWSNCVKIRIGGGIPGEEESKNGFYCENGLIKSVDSKGNTVYELSPDGSLNFGKGKIVYNPYTDQLVFGEGVTLTWGNLSPDAQENLKGDPGEPGKDATTYYTWIAYSDYSDGANLYFTPTSSTKYIGIAPNKTSKPPTTNKLDYTWSRFRGTDGQNAVFYLFEFYQEEKAISYISSYASGRPKSESDIVFKLYKIDGDSKSLCADYYLGIKITYPDGNEDYFELGKNSYALFSPVDGITFTVYAKESDVESGNTVVTSSVYKIMDGEKGADGEDANLLPWVEEWNNNRTLISGDYVISPKMFSGTKNVETEKLTGVAIGRDVITVEGVQKTGIFGLNDGKMTFSLDAETGAVAAYGSIAEVPKVLDATEVSWGKDLNFEEGFNWSVFHRKSGNVGVTINLPTDPKYAGVRSNIINPGYYEDGILKGGDVDIEIAGGVPDTFRVNRKLVYDDSKYPVYIIALKIRLNGIAQLYAVLDGSNNLHWYLMNPEDFYVNPDEDVILTNNNTYEITYRTGGVLNIKTE